MVGLIQDINQNIKIRDIRLDQNKHKATVEGVLTTDNVKQDFYWRECGLYAIDSDFGEILYSYAYLAKPEFIATSDNKITEEILLSMITTINSNTNVDVTIDDGMVSTSKKEFLPVKSKMDAVIDAEYLLADDIGLVKFEINADIPVDYVSQNAKILQPYLDEGCNIKFGEGRYVFESQLRVKSNCIRGVDRNKTSLLFPNSKGIVYGFAGYYANILFKDFSITSDDICIDYKGDGVTYPNNVFQSEYSRLNLKSTNGIACIHAGDNRGIGSDQLIFEFIYTEIQVACEFGAGFFGITGLGIKFRSCRDGYKIKYVFQNCSGEFLDINTSFAGAEYFLYWDEKSPMLFSAKLYMRNCNMEDMTKGGIRIDNPNVSFDIDVKNATVTYASTAKLSLPLETHPIYLSYITHYRGTFDYGLGDRSWSDMFGSLTESCVSYSNLQSAEVSYITDGNSMYCRNTRSIVKSNPYKTRAMPSLFEHKFGTRHLTKYEEVISDFFHGYIIPVTKNITITESSSYDLHYQYEGFNILNVSNNYSSSYKIRTIINNLPGQTCIGNLLVVHNSGTHDIILEHNYAMAGKIFLLGSSNYVLKPNKFIVLVRHYAKGSGLLWYQLPIGTISNSGSTINRPEDAYRSFNYFDTTIGKPIWWTGTKWVDATGADA